MQLDTAKGNILMASKEPDLFERLFGFYGITGPTSYPKLPKGDISFLDVIPPIGTKLATNINSTPDDLGPQSEPNHVDSIFNHTLYFHFGLLKE